MALTQEELRLLRQYNLTEETLAELEALPEEPLPAEVIGPDLSKGLSEGEILKLAERGFIL